MMGYLVDLKEKGGPFDTGGEYKKVLMTRETLSRSLLMPSKYCIFSAASVNIEEYQADHSKVKLLREHKE